MNEEHPTVLRNEGLNDQAWRLTTTHSRGIDNRREASPDPTSRDVAITKIYRND